MTVAFDAATEAVRTATTDPYAFDHTPVGTPRAVVVALLNYTTATDQVTTVTYGGVAMAEIVAATDTSGETTNVQLWFLGASIPTGLRSVSVDFSSATADDFHIVCMTFTAAGNCVVQDSDSISEDLDDPQRTLQYSGKSCLAVCALAGGLPNVTDYTPVASMSTVHDNDSGNEIQRVDRQTTAGTSDFTIGYTTAGADDVSFCCLAITDDISITVTPAGLAATTAFGAPKIAVVTVPSGIAATVVFGSSKIAVVTVPSGIAATVAFGVPIIDMGGETVTPAGIAATVVFGTPIIQIITAPPGIAATVAFGAPVIPLLIRPAGIAATVAFGAPVIPLLIRPASIAATVAFGAPVIPLLIRPASIAATVAFGIPGALLPVVSYLVRYMPTILLSAEHTPQVGNLGRVPSILQLIVVFDPEQEA
jgi:hypothetical protein